MRVMPPKGARSSAPDWRFSHAFSRRTADYTDEYGSNGRCHPESRMLSGRGTSHKHETFSAPMSILRKNDISAGIDDPGAKNGSPGTTANDGGYNLPNSKKIYVAGEIHFDIGVPFREISLAPTKTMTREIEVNEPMRVYDTSGPWGDPDFRGTVEEGLPRLRAKWIRDRGDVEDYAGRALQPIDDGYISEAHAGHAKSKRLTPNAERRTPNSNGNDSNVNASPASSFAAYKPLRAKPGNCVTQLYYA